MKITLRRARFLSWIGVFFIRALGCTWRVRRLGVQHPEGSVPILTFLHGDLLLPTYLSRHTRTAVLISQHGDGEIIAQIIMRFGYATVRGSSTRGGARAFLELVRNHKDRPFGVTPDGPKGPRGIVQEGVIQLAAATGRPIYAMSYAVAWAKRLSSWDRFVIPGPFARIVWHYAVPLLVPKDLTPEQRAGFARELERRLANGHEEAQKALDAW